MTVGCDHLLNFGRQIDRVRSALRLLDFVQSDPRMFRPSQRKIFPQLFKSWIFFAAREIIITVDDFHKSLTAAKTMFDRSNSLRSRFVPPLEAARERFIARFPDHDGLRNVACHLVDYSLKPKDVDKNSFSGTHSQNGISLVNVTKVMASENIYNRTISYTAGGIFLKFDLVDDVAISLERITLDFAKSSGLEVF